jgi:hypothetical protein
MKTLFSILVCLVLAAACVFAAGIDGKWVSERKMSRDGQEFTITTVFDLKSDGGTLTGTLTSTTPMGDRKAEIKDGKIDGDKFSFVVMMQTPNGEFKTTYEGKVEGDSLKGTMSREGGQGRPFEAKRQ